jgi:maleylpyruvate isomerase
MQFTLYSYPKSSASWRVRIALDLKNIPYTIHDVNLLDNGQYDALFLRLNPNASVPMLKVQGPGSETHYLAQSTAIIEFLESLGSVSSSLYPTNIFEQAKIRNVVNLIACDIHPIQNLRVLKQIEKMGGSMEKKQWAQLWIKRGFSILENMLKDTAGDYSFGNTVTMADVYLIPQCFNAKRFECFSKDDYPTLNRIYDNCMLLDAFSRTAPTL